MSKPVITLLDIETSPLTIYSWATYDTSALKVLQPSRIISFSWKELEADEIFVKTIVDYKGYKPGIVDDSKIVHDAWKVLDESDIVIAHHGDGFDLKKLNARFVINGLSPPSDYESVDTLKAAKRWFKFDSNNLNALGGYLEVGKKINNGGFSLWEACIAGDLDAWKRMAAYNKQDVLLLEQVYLKLRPYIENHPNVNTITGNFSKTIACSSCGSGRVTKRGFSFTALGRKQRYQCGDCSSWSTGPYERVYSRTSSETASTRSSISNLSHAMTPDDEDAE